MMKRSTVMTSLASVMTLMFGSVALAAPQQGPETVQEQRVERSGDHMSDAAITANVKSALLSQASGMQVSVSTTDGEVTLRGEVTSQADINAIERIVRNVDGVRSVRNELKVK